MNRIFFFGAVSIIMVIFLVGISTAANLPSNIITIQGGESRITNGSAGEMEITIIDIVLNINITNGNKSYSIPVEGLTNVTFPADAALVLSGAQNESISMMRISNLSLSHDNKILTLQVSPLRFYDGEGLRSFADNQTDLSPEISGDDNTSQLYLETDVKLAENSDQTCPPGLYYCGMYGKCVSMDLCMIR